MKTLHNSLPVLMLLSAAAFAQTDAPKLTTSTVPKAAATKVDAPKSEAQQAFALLKTLDGKWEGNVTTTPPSPEIQGALMNVTLRTTSMGNAIMHEMTSTVRPDDPITMLYLDGDQVMLTHYCDAGNRPRMIGKVSPDGKSVEFDFHDITGNTKYGHMHHAKFTAINENKHLEEWTFVVNSKEGPKPVVAHIELRKKN